jgi:hypothetical protein
MHPPTGVARIFLIGPGLGTLPPALLLLFYVKTLISLMLFTYSGSMLCSLRGYEAVA